MQTDFFKGKKLWWIALVASLTVVVYIGVYITRLSSAKIIDCGKRYYFLVSTEQKVEVGAEFIRLDGGAGYLLSHNGKEYVALSVYTSVTDGKSVQAHLQAQGKETLLLSVGGGRLYFKGAQKQNSTAYVNALRILESYISVLNECITRLEKGSTQESCKRLLYTLQRQFTHAAKLYGEYGECAAVFRASAERLKEISTKTVYLKDLRYLLCWQVERYVGLCQAFTM